MDPILGVAFYIILWWLSFFLVLPFGVRSLDEAGEAHSPGHDRGAPASPSVRKKALWAAGLAAILWVVVAVGLQVLYYGPQG
jgi:predicted secreted protein